VVIQIAVSLARRACDKHVRGPGIAKQAWATPSDSPPHPLNRSTAVTTALPCSKSGRIRSWSGCTGDGAFVTSAL
jgi:hypothetical protein